MREHLYRGKVLETEAIRYSGQSPKWAVGNLHRDPSGGDCSISDYDTCFSFGVDPETVGQFTGLLDKNGVKIFEGDIVQLFDKYHNCTAKGYGKIIFSYEYVGGWVITSNGEDRLSLGIHTDIVEVIGNIHDNPELLEVKP